MKASEFVEKAKLAASFRTVYAKGMWGSPITAQIIAEKQKQYPTWYKASKVQTLMGLVDFSYFGFDCVCLIKSILWGWNGDMAHKNGGATYKANDVPDFTVDSLMDRCTEVSDDFSKIVPGEVVYMPGHCGIYIGDNLVVEATGSWEKRVLISTIDKNDEKHHLRTWAKHGKIDYVDYNTVKIIDVSVPVIKRGYKGDAAKALQALLNGYGADPVLDVDGSCGAKTEAAIKAFQAKRGLSVDGSCGKKTWNELLNGEDKR